MQILSLLENEHVWNILFCNIAIIWNMWHMVESIFFFFKDFFNVSLLLREIERAQVELGQREREAQNPESEAGSSSELSAQSAIWGLNSQIVRS